MEKRMLTSPAVFQKTNRIKSYDCSIEKRLESVDEKINQIQNFKPADRFQLCHGRDLQPRLRKSMLARELETVDQKVISSTPHYLKNSKTPIFFNKELSILLSPISSGTRSAEKNKSVNEQNKKEKVLQKNCAYVSSEIASNNDKNITSHIRNNQKDKQSLWKSRKNKNINRSAVEDKSLNTVNEDPKNKSAHKSFNIHEQSDLKSRDKSPEKNLMKSPVKLPAQPKKINKVGSPGKSSSVPKTASKKRKNPFKTASHEKKKALEVNNNLQANKNESLNEDHRTACTTPRKRTRKVLSPQKKAVAEKLLGGPSGELKTVPLQTGNKETNDYNPINDHIQDHDDDENNIINISSRISSTSFHGNDNSANLANRPTSNNHKNISRLATSQSSSNNALDHDRTEFVNKTPRRKNNQTCSSQAAVCNKNANTPTVLTGEPSSCGKPDVINKSTGKAQRCKPADRSEGEIEKNHPQPYSSLMAEISARKAVVDKEIQTLLTGPQKKKIADVPEEKTSNNWNNIMTEISAKKQTVTQNAQTATSRNLRPLILANRKEKFIFIEDELPEPVEEAGPSSDWFSNLPSSARRALSYSGSSSGAGSDIVDAAFDCWKANRASKWQIFESLAEENTLDGLNFSEPEELDQFSLFNKTASKKPWRFSGESLDPEITSAPLSSKSFLWNNQDSTNSGSPKNKTLGPRKTKNVPTLTKQAKKRQYHTRNLKSTNDDYPPGDTVTSLAPGTFGDENVSLEGTSTSIIQNNCQTSTTRHEHTQSETVLSRNSGETLTDKRKYNACNKTTQEPCQQAKMLTRSAQLTTTSNVPKDMTIMETKKSRYHKKSFKMTKEVTSLTPESLHNENVSLEGASISVIQNNDSAPTTRQEHKQNEAVVSTKSEKALTNNRKCNKKGRKKSQEPVQQLMEPVSSTLERTCQTANDGDNLSGTANQKHCNQQSKGVRLKGHAEETPSTSSKRSRPNNRNVSLANSSFSSTESIAISSVDQQLLGIIPLLDVTTGNVGTRRPAEETPSKATKKSRPDNRKASLANRSTSNTKNVALSSVDQQLLEIEAFSEVITGNKETGPSTSSQHFPSGSKGNKRRGTKNKPGKSSSASLITSDNILPSIDARRSQRIRKPTTCLIDIIVDEQFLLDFQKKLTRRKVGRPRKGEVAQNEHKPKPGRPRNLKSGNPSVSMPPPNTSDSGLNNANDINTTKQDSRNLQKKATRRKVGRPRKGEVAQKELTPKPGRRRYLRSSSEESLVPEGPQLENTDENIPAQPALRRVSESSRIPESSESSTENLNRLRSFRTFHQIPSDVNVNCVIDGELCSLRFCNNVPSDTEYTRFGNIEVNQSVSHPKDVFCAGHIRLQPGDHKQPARTTKYSFVYFVINGTALVYCQNRQNRITAGGFFIIPVGSEYSIHNTDSKSKLFMAYTKFKDGASG